MNKKHNKENIQIKRLQHSQSIQQYPLEQLWYDSIQYDKENYNPLKWLKHKVILIRYPSRRHIRKNKLPLIKGSK